MGTLAEAIYLHLCGILAGALRTLGVDTHWQAVAGSFCDGRFNLAWGSADDARKIAGTAQYWRRGPDKEQPPPAPAAPIGGPGPLPPGAAPAGARGDAPPVEGKHTGKGLR